MDDRTPGQASNTDLGYHILRLQVFIAAASVKNDIEARSRTAIQLVPKREGVERPLHNRALARGQAQMLLAIAGVDEAIELAQTGKFKPVEVALGLFLNCDRRTHLANLESLGGLLAVAFEYAKQFCKTLSGDDKNSVPIRSTIAQAIDGYAHGRGFKSAISKGNISSQGELMVQIDRIEALEKVGPTSSLVEAVHFMEDIHNSGTGAFIDSMSSKIGDYYDIVDAMKGEYGVQVDERPIADAIYEIVTPTAEEVYGNLQKVVAELVGKIKDPNFQAAATAQAGGVAGGTVQSPQKRKLAASRGRRPGNVAASDAVDLPSPQRSAGGHSVPDHDGRSSGGSSPTTASLSSGGGSPMPTTPIPEMTAPIPSARNSSRPSVRGRGGQQSVPRTRSTIGKDGAAASETTQVPVAAPRRPTRRREKTSERQFVEQILGRGSDQAFYESFEDYIKEQLQDNSVDPSIWDQQTSQKQFAAVLQDFKRSNEGNIASLSSGQSLEKISGFIAEKGNNIVRDLVQELDVATALPTPPKPDYGGVAPEGMSEWDNRYGPPPPPPPSSAPRPIPAPRSTAKIGGVNEASIEI